MSAVTECVKPEYRPAGKEADRKGLIRQALHLKEQFGFYKSFYKDIALNPDDSFEELIVKLPKINKSVFKAQDPFSLLPDNFLSVPAKLPVMHKTTGGTTGRPANVFYTANDWATALEAHALILRPIFASLHKPVIAYNNYNHGHIGGPVFGQSVTAAGALCINRSFNADDERAIDEISRYKCNMLVAPPSATRKGYTLESLLEADAASGTNYINGDNIDVVLVSSLPLRKELVEELQELGIKFILDFYGMTEVMPVAVSCPYNPRHLHICGGHAYADVVNSSFKPVKTGERGMIIAGRINAYDANGGVSDSTGILNFITGDTALVVESGCSCGENLKTITDVRRESDTESKAENGCQTW